LKKHYVESKWFSSKIFCRFSATENTFRGILMTEIPTKQCLFEDNLGKSWVSQHKKGKPFGILMKHDNGMSLASSGP